MKTSSLEPTAKALGALGNLIEKDPKLSKILSAPTLSAEDKSAIIAELEKSVGASGETVKNFLRTLSDYNRLSLLGPVCSKFGELISAARGEVEVVVTSAQVSVFLRERKEGPDKQEEAIAKIMKADCVIFLSP